MTEKTGEACWTGRAKIPAMSRPRTTYGLLRPREIVCEERDDVSVLSNITVRFTRRGDSPTREDIPGLAGDYCHPDTNPNGFRFAYVDAARLIACAIRHDLPPQPMVQDIERLVTRFWQREIAEIERVKSLEQIMGSSTSEEVAS